MEEILGGYRGSLAILLIAVLWICLSTRLAAGSELLISDLRCEYRVDPIGIDETKPRLSWVLDSIDRGQVQTGYQILVARTRDRLKEGKADLWDSGKVSSDQSVHVVYSGRPLVSRQDCYWKVRVWDKHGKPSNWSKPASWSMGLLSSTDWKASWIGLNRGGDQNILAGSKWIWYPDDGPSDKLPVATRYFRRSIVVPGDRKVKSARLVITADDSFICFVNGTEVAARMLRKELHVHRNVKRARVYVCGLGLFEMYIDGKRIGDHVLSPGLTDYRKRVLYITHDVTDQVQRQGVHSVAIMLGNGRYFAPRSNSLSFGYPKLFLQMEIEYDGGKVTTLVSDRSWKLSTEGPIRANNEFDGEEYDATMECKGWNEPGFDDSGWQKADLVEATEGVLVAQMAEPIRVMETIRPVAVSNLDPGVYIFDMGQNMVGWCRLRVAGPRGTKLSLRHAERLTNDGRLYLDNIRSAKVTDIYTLKGEGTEVYEPRFTYHGFRYVEVAGFPGKPDLSTIEGRVVHDSLERVGEFSCSNRLINQIYSNIYWGIRGNYRSIPTDCPQRDERMGWTGDRTEESRGEMCIFDCASLYNKWIKDMEDAQLENGSVSDVVPAYWQQYTDVVSWPTCTVIIPGHIYDCYGDKRILETHYSSMKKWMDRMKEYLVDYISPRDRYGDWCLPPESPELSRAEDTDRKTSGEIIASAYYYHDLQFMARYATVLGKSADAAQYLALAEKIKVAFNAKFFDSKTNRYSNGTQTSYILPLAFGLVPKEHKQQVFANLVDKILTECKGHLATGLIGCQWLMRVLSDNGRPDVAYALVSQTSYPSWGYMIENGATTIWELWNGNSGDPFMNSHNHVMLIGDLNTWLHEHLAGIAPDPCNPGFKHIIMRPRPVSSLSFVTASLETMHGKIKSDWRIDGDALALDVTIPVNTTAAVYVPTNNPATVVECDTPASQAEGVRFIGVEDDAAVYAVGSGRYRFRSEWKRR